MPAPAPAAHPRVLSRTVVREPAALPGVPPFPAPPTLTVSSSVSTGDVADQAWFPFAFGAAFVLAGVAVAWIGWNVEPQEPSEASRWVALAFGVMFALAGCYVLLSAALGAIARPNARPPASWREDHPWRETVHHQTGLGSRPGVAERVRSAVFAVILALLYGILHLPLFWGTEYLETRIGVLEPLVEISGALPWTVAMVIFDLILLGILAVAAHLAVQRLRFGRATLRLGTFPAHPGGTLEVEVRIGRGVPARGPALCALHCIDEGARPPVEGDGGSPVAVHTETVHLDTAGTRVRELRLAFEVPADAPGTRLSVWPRVYWRLRVRVPARGGDFTADYLVPVYAPAARPVEAAAAI